MYNMEFAWMESLEQILQDTIIPGAPEVDRLGCYPQAGMDALAEAGILGMFSGPDPLGTMSIAVRIIETIARHCSHTAALVAHHLVGALVIARHGSEQLNRAIAEGRHVTTLALHDQASSNVVWSALSSVVPLGGDFWMRGVKCRVIGGGKVNSYIWPAMSIRDDHQVTLWSVPQSTESMEVMEFYVDAAVRGHVGSTVAADGVRLEARHRLGDEGKGNAILGDLILPALDLLLSAIQVGLMEAVTRRSATHCVKLVAGFDGGRLLESAARAIKPFQAGARPLLGLDDEVPDFRALIGRMRARTTMVRSNLWETASLFDRQVPGATRATYALKAIASEMANEVTAMGMVIGEHTLERGGALERCYRDARSGLVHTFSPDTFYECVGRDEFNLTMVRY